ncbi:hypothetical protein [Flammeovirga sp. EKP202]|uniref:hypothetical protein n=1 Tax=Flammeovirga sp. EKP202 TaxID=2770592 RepID=UPI00165FE004|nr:hypothetical protein [Flammeovirga sp. EKP202]MBD0401234.1 hypothetical protein [Flammeovirga sp. EKP202]
MNTIKTFLVVVSIIMIGFSCAKNDVNSNTIEITGVIKAQGITTYQYGTHTVSGYALRSSSVNLDNYIDQEVTIVGQKVEGYPVDGGPDYIEVEKVK